MVHLLWYERFISKALKCALFDELLALGIPLWHFWASMDCDSVPTYAWSSIDQTARRTKRVTWLDDCTTWIGGSPPYLWDGWMRFTIDVRCSLFTDPQSSRLSELIFMQYPIWTCFVAWALDHFILGLGCLWAIPFPETQVVDNPSFRRTGSLVRSLVRLYRNQQTCAHARGNDSFVNLAGTTSSLSAKYHLQSDTRNRASTLFLSCSGSRQGIVS